MENIADLFNSLTNKNAPLNILGEGSYSLVFDVGEAYKLTNEITSKKAHDTFSKVNKLKSRGVNVPKIYRIDSFKATDAMLINNVKRIIMQNTDKIKLNESLKAFTCNYKNNIGEYEYVGIFREKVNGVNLFNKNNTNFIKLFNQSSVKNNTLLGNAKDNLENQEHKLLDALNSIDEKHYTKFVDDGLEIMNSGMVIDDILGNNFLYGENGFVYIDLNGLENVELKGASNVFDFTINAICNSVYTKITNLNAEIYQKQLQLAQKLTSSLQKCNKNEQFLLQFNQYIEKDNSFIKLINASADCLNTKKSNAIRKQLLNQINEIKELGLAK